jgi:uncharacterized protein (TIGR02145 family)
MNLKSLLSLVFGIGVIFNLHGQILPVAFGVATPSRPVASNLGSSGPIITSGLVLHLDAGNTFSYPGSGTTWTDLSGNGNNGTLTNGPTYTSSNGGAIVFDGINDFVNSGSSISLPGDISVFAWVYATSFNTNWNLIVTKWFSPDQAQDFHWALKSSTSGANPKQNLYTTSNSDIYGNSTFSLNTWYHVGFTLVNGGTLTFYKNGVADGTSNSVSRTSQISNLQIGESRANVAAGLKGRIPQVSIYNRVLTAAEVLQNYNALSPRFGDVTNPTTGKTWMDRNLGASQVATSSTDTNAYGDLYQWGRGTDGHQLRSAASTSTLSSSVTPGNNLYIINRSTPYDWISPQNANLWQGASGVNNPCPSGFRVPTEAEWAAEVATWSSGQNATGAFASPLKLPLAGYRYTHTDALTNVGTIGHYWTSTVSVSDPSYSYAFDINSSNAVRSTYGRVDARSVRCIQN